MTEDDLVADLARLLRDGLVYLDGVDDVPRFAVTAKGRELSTAERLFTKPHFQNADSEATA